MKKEEIIKLLKVYDKKKSRIYPQIAELNNVDDDYEYKRLEKQNERLYDQINAHWLRIIDKVNYDTLGYTLEEMKEMKENPTRWSKFISDYTTRGRGRESDTLKEMQKFANTKLVNRLYKKYFDN